MGVVSHVTAEAGRACARMGPDPWEDIVSLPPLVEPATELTVDEIRRYSRHLIIPDVAVIGQKRLKNARVLVIGAGGLGSPALLYLAAAGVGTLGIVEFDTVDESNLQRQIIHGQSDIGRPKAESAAASVREINPYVDVVVHNAGITRDKTLARMRPGAVADVEAGPRAGHPGRSLRPTTKHCDHRRPPGLARAGYQSNALPRVIRQTILTSASAFSGPASAAACPAPRR